MSETTEPSTTNVKHSGVSNNQARLIGLLIALIVGGGVFFLATREEGFTEEARTSYVSACVEQSGQQQLCECTYDRLAEQISYSDFKALDERAATGATTQEDNELVTGVAFACVAELQGSLNAQ